MNTTYSKFCRWHTSSNLLSSSVGRWLWAAALVSRTERGRDFEILGLSQNQGTRDWEISVYLGHDQRKQRRGMCVGFKVNGSYSSTNLSRNSFILVLRGQRILFWALCTLMIGNLEIDLIKSSHLFLWSFPGYMCWSMWKIKYKLMFIS